jgi:DNA ligase-associated metallophosphoesterase
MTDMRDQTTLTIAGRTFVTDPSGALWCAAARLLVVSDLHLEKGSAFARRGVPLPPYDTAETLRTLATVVHRFQPRTIVSLGDSFHDQGGPARMSHDDARSLAALQAGREWIWIAGNHDPRFDGEIAGRFLPELTDGAIRFVHEPTAGAVTGEIAGHLHPSAVIAVRGGRIRRKVFVSCETRLVMPAFGSFTGGLDIADPAIRSLFPARPSVVALGSGRTYRIAA